MTRLLLVLLVVLCAVPAAASAEPPANDTRQEPQVIDGLPARVSGTTVDAQSESDDPGSRCAGSRNSVFYEFRAGADGRVFLRLQADGDLDAVIDVYRRNRSQLEGLECAQTDEDGLASIGMNVKDGTTYLIRVAQLTNSVSGTFTLQLDRATPAARPPGVALPSGGRRDSVDRVLNPTDAWAVSFKAGHTYRVNLFTPRLDARASCVSLAVYRPGTKDFDLASPVARRGCGG
jgi:hypothetical protein